MPRPRRVLPKPSRDLLFHPEHDAGYDHFLARAGGGPAFDLSATALSNVNAAWLADAALLAYWPADQARARFAAAGLERYQFVQSSGALRWEDTQCHVAGNDSFIICAFRGTQSDQILDILNDAEFKLRPVPGGAGSAHTGFQLALDAVWDKVLAAVAQVIPTGRSPVLWFTGHSLGAALATLAALRYAERGGAGRLLIGGVYTIGSPRVGDGDFRRRYEGNIGGKTFRFVNDHDIVPQVPPTLPLLLPFEHVGGETYFDESGNPAQPPHGLAARFDGAIGTASQAAAVVRGVLNLNANLDSALPNFLVDHTPRRYADLIWNLVP